MLNAFFDPVVTVVLGSTVTLIVLIVASIVEHIAWDRRSPFIIIVDRGDGAAQHWVVSPEDLSQLSKFMNELEPVDESDTVEIQHAGRSSEAQSLAAAFH